MAAKKKPLEMKPAQLGEQRITDRARWSFPPSAPAGRIIGEGAAAVPELVRLLQTEAKVSVMANVFAFAESRGGALRQVAFEAVTAARALADATGGGEVHALLAGAPGIAALASELGKYGADVVIVRRACGARELRSRSRSRRRSARARSGPAAIAPRSSRRARRGAISRRASRRSWACRMAADVTDARACGRRAGREASRHTRAR